MMTTRHFASLTIALGTLGFALGLAGPAEADVVNTYNGAECRAIFPGQEINLVRQHGIRASTNTLVVCPVVKNIFNSTASVTAGVVASGGSTCSLESYDVFTNQAKESGFKEFPGQGISAVEYTIPSSFRGAMQLRCFLGPQDELRSYGVTER
jgi:hypothetical protein